MKLNATGLAGVLVVGALTAGAFAAGTRLEPAQPVGHNLYHPAPTAAPTGARVALAAAGSPGAMAQGPKGPDGPMDGDPAEDLTGDGPGATFQQVYQLIKRHYVDAVPDDSKLAHGAAAAMVASLQDPDSRFLEAPEMAEVNNEARGEYRGIGAALAVRRVAHAKDADIPGYTEYRLAVVAPLPGSPAEKAGLLPGDVISAVNGQWVYNDEFVYNQTKVLKNIQDDPVAFNKLVGTLQKKIDNSVSLSDAQTKLDDPAAKSISLTVNRMGLAQPLALTLDTSAATVVPAIAAHSLTGGIGYIKITEFTADTDRDFATALAGFGTDPKGLILDLRSSPGGLLDVGAAIAARLTTAPNLGYLETKGKKVTPITITAAQALTCPVVVLVNGGTANTAELLASALQSKGAKVVGSGTFGDASDVKVIQLRDGSGFTMTVGKLMTASQADFAGIGIKPDVAVPDAAVPDAAGSDEPLDRALGVLSGRVARVPSDRG